MMDVRLAGLHAFVHTAERASFTRAGARLGISAAAVSKAVRRLEEELGTRLLERTSRRVALTPEGDRYLPHARAALDALAAGADELAEAQAVAAGRARVTIPHVFLAPVLAALPRFLARHPRLEVDLRVGDLDEDLVADEIDVALRVGVLPDSTLGARRLRRATWATVASPAWVARHGLPARPADLAAAPAVVFARRSGTDAPWWFTGPTGEAEPLAPRAVLRCDRGDALVDAAIAGIGAAQVFDFMAAAPVADGRLVPLLPRLAAPAPPLHAVFLAGRQRTPRVAACLELVSAAVG